MRPLRDVAVAMALFASFTLLLATLALRADLYENILYAGVGISFCGVCLFSVLRWPPLGIALLLVSGIFVAFEPAAKTKTGLTAPYVLAPILFACWSIGMAKRRTVRSWISSCSVLPLMLLLLFSILSLLVAPLLSFPISAAPMRAQLGQLGVFLFSGGLFLLSAHQLRDLRWLRRVTALFLVLGAIHVALRFIPRGDQLPGILGSGYARGSLFWTWLMAMAFAQASLNRHLHTVWRLASAALVVAAIYVTFLKGSDWASGWLPGFVAILVILYLRRPVVAVLIVAVGGFFVAANWDVVTQSIWTSDQQYSLATRSQAFVVLSQIIRENPLLGVGPANYYHYTPLYPIMGWYVNFSSHNNYIDILAQTGVLGLISFGWFLAALGLISLRLRRNIPEGFPAAYVHGAIGGLAGTVCAAALGDWFLPFVYNVGLSGFPSSVLGWIFLGGLVAVEQIFAKGEALGSESPMPLAAAALGRRCATAGIQRPTSVPSNSALNRLTQKL